MNLLREIWEWLVVILWMKENTAFFMKGLSLLTMPILAVGGFFYQQWWAIPPFAFVLCVNRLAARILRQTEQAREQMERDAGTTGIMI